MVGRGGAHGRQLRIPIRAPIGLGLSRGGAQTTLARTVVPMPQVFDQPRRGRGRPRKFQLTSHVSLPPGHEQAVTSDDPSVDPEQEIEEGEHIFYEEEDIGQGPQEEILQEDEQYVVEQIAMEPLEEEEKIPDAPTTPNTSSGRFRRMPHSSPHKKIRQKPAPILTPTVAVTPITPMDSEKKIRSRGPMKRPNPMVVIIRPAGGSEEGTSSGTMQLEADVKIEQKASGSDQSPTTSGFSSANRPSRNRQPSRKILEMNEVVATPPPRKKRARTHTSSMSQPREIADESEEQIQNQSQGDQEAIGQGIPESAVPDQLQDSSNPPILQNMSTVAGAEAESGAPTLTAMTTTTTPKAPENANVPPVPVLLPMTTGSTVGVVQKQMRIGARPPTKELTVGEVVTQMVEKEKEKLAEMERKKLAEKKDGKPSKSACLSDTGETAEDGFLRIVEKAAKEAGIPASSSGNSQTTTSAAAASSRESVERLQEDQSKPPPIRHISQRGRGRGHVTLPGNPGRTFSTIPPHRRPVPKDLVPPKRAPMLKEDRERREVPAMGRVRGAVAGEAGTAAGTASGNNATSSISNLRRVPPSTSTSTSASGQVEEGIGRGLAKGGSIVDMNPDDSRRAANLECEESYKEDTERETGEEQRKDSAGDEVIEPLQPSVSLEKPLKKPIRRGGIAVQQIDEQMSHTHTAPAAYAPSDVRMTSSAQPTSSGSETTSRGPVPSSTTPMTPTRKVHLMTQFQSSERKDRISGNDLPYEHMPRQKAQHVVRAGLVPNCTYEQIKEFDQQHLMVQVEGETQMVENEDGTTTTYIVTSSGQQIQAEDGEDGHGHTMPQMVHGHMESVTEEVLHDANVQMQMRQGEHAFVENVMEMRMPTIQREHTVEQTAKREDGGREFGVDEVGREESIGEHVVETSDEQTVPTDGPSSQRRFIRVIENGQEMVYELADDEEIVGGEGVEVMITEEEEGVDPARALIAGTIELKKEDVLGDEVKDPNISKPVIDHKDAAGDEGAGSSSAQHDDDDDLPPQLVPEEVQDDEVVAEVERRQLGQRTAFIQQDHPEGEDPSGFEVAFEPQIIRVQSPGGRQHDVQVARDEHGREVFLNENNELVELFEDNVQFVDEIQGQGGPDDELQQHAVPPHMRRRPEGRGRVVMTTETMGEGNETMSLRNIEFNFLDNRNICCGLCGEIVPYESLVNDHLPNAHPETFQNGLELEEVPYESWLKSRLRQESKNMENGFRQYDDDTNYTTMRLLSRGLRQLRRVSQIRVNPNEMSLPQLEVALQRKMVEKMHRKVPVTLVDRIHAKCGICQAVVSLNKKFEVVHLVRHFNAWHPSAHRCTNEWKMATTHATQTTKFLSLHDFAVVDTESEQNNLQCIWCGTFMDRTAVGMHFSEVHGDQVEVPKCSLCLQEMVLCARLIEKYGEDFGCSLPDEFHVMSQRLNGNTYTSEKALDKAIEKFLKRVRNGTAGSGANGGDPSTSVDNDGDYDYEDGDKQNENRQDKKEVCTTNSRQTFGKRNRLKRHFVKPCFRQVCPPNSEFFIPISACQWKCKLCNQDVLGAVISAGAIKHFKEFHPAEIEKMQLELVKARLERISDGSMEFVHAQLVECLICNLTYSLHKPYNICRAIRHLRIKHPEVMPEFNGNPINGSGEDPPVDNDMIETANEVKRKASIQITVGELLDDPITLERFRRLFDDTEFDKVQTIYADGDKNSEPQFILLNADEEFDEEMAQAIVKDTEAEKEPTEQPPEDGFGSYVLDEQTEIRDDRNVYAQNDHIRTMQHQNQHMQQRDRPIARGPKKTTVSRDKSRVMMMMPPRRVMQTPRIGQMANELPQQIVEGEEEMLEDVEMQNVAVGNRHPQHLQAGSSNRGRGPAPHRLPRMERLERMEQHVEYVTYQDYEDINGEPMQIIQGVDDDGTYQIMEEEIIEGQFENVVDEETVQYMTEEEIEAAAQRGELQIEYVNEEEEAPKQ